MPRKKNDLNTIYISERLQEKLRPDLPVYPDNGGSSYGLWEDHVCKLVSE